MKIRIPFASTSESAEPLRQCLEQTAERSGLEVYQAALIISHFWDAVADQVCRGRAVSIPGFGRFGALVWTPRKAGLSPHCYPAFSASRAYRALVAFACSPESGCVRSMMRHRRHHHLSSRPDRRRARTFTALKAFRDRIVADARDYGFDVDG